MNIELRSFYEETTDSVTIARVDIKENISVPCFAMPFDEFREFTVWVKDSCLVQPFKESGLMVLDAPAISARFFGIVVAEPYVHIKVFLNLYLAEWGSFVQFLQKAYEESKEYKEMKRKGATAAEIAVKKGENPFIGMGIIWEAQEKKE